MWQILARNAEQAAGMVGYVLKKQVEISSLHFLLPDGQRLDCSTDAYARLEEVLELKRDCELAADRVFTEMRFRCNTKDNHPWQHNLMEDGGVVLSCRIFLQTELPGWPDEYEYPPPEVEGSLKVVFAAGSQEPQHAVALVDGQEIVWSAEHPSPPQPA